MRSHALALILYVVGTIALVIAAFGLATSNDFNIAYLGLAFLGAGLAADCSLHRV